MSPAASNCSEQAGRPSRDARPTPAVSFVREVLGTTVTVKMIDITAAGMIVALCYRGRECEVIPILELALPDPPPAGSEWIEAYRRWGRGRW